MESYLVIGGEGFLGHNMILALLKRYPSASISSLDLVQRYFPDQSASWSFYSADLTDLKSLSDAIRACHATTVFHTASPWAGSSKEVCEKVNVVGTQTVVDACVQEGVKKLVFTSSAGTVYNGEDLINVDERLPFPEKPIDFYNVTKAQAETIVLEANDKQGLLTVAIRPAGIFGPGDRQALLGFMKVLKDGKTGFQVGNNHNLFDWTYVDNIVHAHLLAAERIEESVNSSVFEYRLPPVSVDAGPRVLPTSLYRPESLLEREIALDPSWTNTREPDGPLPAARNRYDQWYGSADKPLPKKLRVAGQAFFITNGEPIGFWDLMRVVWFEYNGHQPKRIIGVPYNVGYVVAVVGEAIARALGRPPPSLTKVSVVYTTAHRFYNIEKARRMLGYEPIVGLEEGVKRAVAWYKANETLASTPKTQ